MIHRVTRFLFPFLLASGQLTAQEAPPYALQVEEHRARLQADDAATRAGAAEALGFLRAYEAGADLVARLRDPSPLVRRESAMALAWCGDRQAVAPLMDALGDEDWMTCQAAHVSLTNLTGMEFPCDASAARSVRSAQINRWRTWWATVPRDRPPAEVLQLLEGAQEWGSAWSVTASTTYRGPADVLTDGQLGPEYWQTKNVAFPQSCTIDLGVLQNVHEVAIHQYGDQFVMTEYELAVSQDGKSFERVERKQGETPVKLSIRFSPRPARYLRITSYGSVRPIYPTTFFEIEVNGKRGSPGNADDELSWQVERGLRALGAFGGSGATEAVLACLASSPSRRAGQELPLRAGVRALGRLREEAGFEKLTQLLGDTHWARYAAEALGDFGDRRAVAALLAAYPGYAKHLDGTDPARLPADDKMTFPSEDRMLETPYAIVYALCRLPWDNAEDRAELRKLAPLLMANLPGDHDTFMLYEPEVGHLLTRYLMEKAGLRQEACEHAFALLGQSRRVPPPADAPAWSQFPPYRISSWLPAVCTEAEDLPRLLVLLEHEEGWVRINAAKTLAWIGDSRAIAPLAKLLTEANAEADFGYSGTFKDEEYNDPAPRWREGLIRALGLLGAHDQTSSLVHILNDDRSVLEIRHAAAVALGDLGNEMALGALRDAAYHHSFHSVRHIARDALRARDAVVAPDDEPRELEAGSRASTAEVTSGEWDAVVFIKGSNDIPNTMGTVEQADRWRQTYVVTDSGPVYRPGRNLYVLRPAGPDGQVTPLTRFRDGYVGDLELSWNARQAIFCRRGQDDPWWHVYRIGLDGSGLEQLTHGPYHDVGPAYLPDGRIVFATTRAGIRDEYHGYPCTALWVMDAEGGQMQPIATNIGRDNEPSILHDGRIAVSRLEVFYSRNKTELTLHGLRPDGTQDRVLYGPERRTFWRQADHGPRTPADGQEAPLTHRVLRMTQPQPMPDGRRVVVVTQGGLALVGLDREQEEIITPDNKTRSYTTPFPLPDGRLLCASTLKVADRQDVDLGLYVFDPDTQQLDLLYNDPAFAEFEPRPVLARGKPPVLPNHADPRGYSGRFVCASVFHTQEKGVPRRGKLVRLIEGVPVVARHSTHTNDWPVWKNHGGTFARVLGTAPLATDGSFFVETPADRLLHFQVLDSDRRVVGNQRTWIYPRPGETRSCVGCHEKPDSTLQTDIPLAQQYPPVQFLPRGDEFRYRAKAWFKGHLPDKIEERTRTVRAVNLLGR